MSLNNRQILCALLAAFTLAGCGGGGGSDSSFTLGSDTAPVCSLLTRESRSACPISEAPVVELLIPTTFGTSRCTGTFISNSAILTAGHCVDDVTAPITVRSVSGATTISESGFVNERFLFTQDSADDIGVLFVAPDFVATNRITPIPIYLNTDLISGDDFSAYGFALNDELQGIRMVVADAEEIYNLASSEFLATIGRGETVGEPNADTGNTCPGDSGGPAVFKTGVGLSGDRRLFVRGIIGVTSAGVFSSDCNVDPFTRFAYISSPSNLSFLNAVEPEFHFVTTDSGEIFCFPEYNCLDQGSEGVSF